MIERYLNGQRVVLVRCCLPITGRLQTQAMLAEQKFLANIGGEIDSIGYFLGLFPFNTSILLLIKNLDAK